MKIDLFLIFSFFLIQALSYDKVAVEVVVESKCPWSGQFETEVAPKLIESIGDIFTMNFDFAAKYENNNNQLTFSCMHGPSECQGNRYELCAQKYYPDKWTYFNFIKCLDQDQSQIPFNAEKCGAKEGLDWNQMKECYSKESPQLLKVSIDSMNTKYPVKYVPTVFINGVEFCVWSSDDGKCPTWDYIRDKICELYQGPKPDACSK
ncbi:gamma-interferon inducible lysosomal thiol reductase gilt [Anaeramoeba flamelloides]|uniref:Gamma-interferon inducible lysosomal thiol reductase gilt n=1 Tax=Anaeramoeba flamelloides TaxID=1746091 RepID=A0AAV7YQJ8_9EUKA|nr:gamma-interferon inducible lysosomal thiol reductase gilt [Anaeramoeba flamelloides]